MRRASILTLALSATIALAAVGVAQAASSTASATKLNGVVGPGFTISISKRSVKAGKVTIRVSDKSSSHNFHITGPGVNKSTSISGTGTVTWTLTLKKGTYRIVCDPHATQMKTSLKVT